MSGSGQVSARVTGGGDRRPGLRIALRRKPPLHSGNAGLLFESRQALAQLGTDAYQLQSLLNAR